MKGSPIIVALDFPTSENAISFAKKIDPKKVRVKVGKELFITSGPIIVERLQDLGFDVFLDLKFHDIPNTVARACVEAAKMGVWMTNVHASGGGYMMEYVMSELSSLSNKPLMLAVTVLTSMDERTLKDIGVSLPMDEQVLRLAELAKTSKMDGVVCSAREAKLLKEKLGYEFLLVTPGIRLKDDNVYDQSRVVTPEKALSDGSDYLVIGRPITKSNSPNMVIDNIINSIKA